MTVHDDPEAHWHWTRPIAGRPEMAGDLSRLFNEGSFDPPELLQPLAESPSASLFAREVLQNSWDAYRQMPVDVREWLGSEGLHVEFRFRELERGHGAHSLRKALGLRQLRNHLDRVDGGRKEVDLSESDCLDGAINDPLTVLEVIEHGGAGMTGPWGTGETAEESAMARALIWVGWANRGDDAGGSYGYGKAGVAQGSRIRSVFAYSCFPEPAPGETVTRRLLGVTYWNRHSADGKTFTGWGLFGRPTGEHEIAPFEDDDADELAAAMGMDLRSPENVGGTGTTIMIVDPNFDSEELINAIGLSWWPALRAPSGLTAEIVDENEDHWETDLSEVESTQAFLEAQDVLSGEVATDDERHRVVDLEAIGFEGASVAPGKLVLMADPAGWSFPSRTGASQIEHRSIVALTRAPQMVVSYHVVGDREPFIRGLFVASPGADAILRRTEPPAHDDWAVRGRDGTTRTHRRFAKELKDAIGREVQAYRDDLAPPVSNRPRVSTPVCGELLAGVSVGKQPANKPRKRGVRDVEKRTVAIRLVHADGIQERPEAVLGARTGTVRARAQVEFRLLDAHPGDEAQVDVELRMRFVEEDGGGGECDLFVGSSPSGFEPSGDDDPGSEAPLHRFSGVLRKGDPVRFLVESADYTDDCSTEFTPKVEVRS